MKIQKYIKDKQNKYKVVIDDEEYILYDDVIIKYNLLMRHEIDEDTFNEMYNLNDELKSYYESIKYINKKLRSEKEIYEYLKKKEINDEIIKRTIEKLKKNNFLNEDIYLKAYFMDAINLSNSGPNKIKSNLIKLGLDEDKINEKLESIDVSIWKNKIDNYIAKKIKLNHNSSSNMLKMKIQNDLINLGYDKELTIDSISHIEVDDMEILKKEYLKTKKSLSKKYEGYELDNKIKEKLYRKGFKISNIKELEDEE